MYLYIYQNKSHEEEGVHSLTSSPPAQDGGWQLQAHSRGAPVPTNLSWYVTFYKYKIFFFNHSPSEFYDADENALYFLQPVAIEADDVLCIDPGGIIQVTYMVFNIAMGYSIKG